MRHSERTSRALKKGLDPLERIGKIAAIGAAVLTLAPIPIVVAVSFSKNWVEGPAGGVTWEWFHRAWERMDQSILVSLQIMFIVLLIDVAVALPASWFVTRYRFPGRMLLRSMSSLPIAIPGIAIGLGLILSFPYLRESGWLLVAGHVLYTTPYLLGTLIPAMDSPKLKDQEVVAASLGMHPLRSFWTVTMPAIRRAMYGGVLMVITLSLGEFNVSFFLFTPTAQPMPVFLFDSYLTGRIEQAAAQTVVFLVLVLVPAALLEKFQSRPSGGA